MNRKQKTFVSFFESPPSIQIPQSFYNFIFILGKVLSNCVQVPLDTEFENPNSVTPLHSAALEALEAVKDVALDNFALIPEVFDVMFKFSRTSLCLNKSINVKDGRFREKFSLFGEACLEFISTFYAKSCEVCNTVLIIYAICSLKVV